MSAIAKPFVHSSGAGVLSANPVAIEEIAGFSKGTRVAQPGSAPEAYTIDFSMKTVDHKPSGSVQWVFSSEVTRDAKFTALQTAVSTAI
jgi:hypothetical protein